MSALLASSDGHHARRVIWSLCAVSFLSNITIGARILIIPLYSSDLGLSAASIGLLYAVFAGVSAVISFPAGVLLDRNGSRWILVMALALIAVAQFMIISSSVPVLVFSQALGGAAWTVSQLSLVTAAISAAPRRQMGRAIGLIALGAQTGLMVGPALAGTLIHMVPFTNLILLTAIPAMTGLGIAVATVRGFELKFGPDHERSSTRTLLENPAIRQVAVLAVATGFVWGTFQAYFAIFASRGMHMPAITIGWLIAIAGLANAVSRIPAGHLVTRFARKDAIVSAAVFGFAASLLVIPHMQGFWPTAILLALTVPLVSLAIMGMSVALAEYGGTDGRGRAISVMYFVSNLASAAAPAILAPVMNYSFSIGFAAASLTGAATVGTALMMYRTRKLARWSGVPHHRT